MTRTPPAAHNLLVSGLPAPDRRLLLAACESVPLELAQSPPRARANTRHAYFPVAGFAALVARADDHPGLEIALVGREGMLGAHLLLGVPAAALDVRVHASGPAWRIEARELQALLATSPALRRRLGRYLYLLMLQFTTAAACQRFHAIGARLAHWLLMIQERAAAGGPLHVTHEALAGMLSVRRVSVTTAAAALQRAGLIRYHRGSIDVLDREGLRARACGCHAVNRLAYARLLGRVEGDALRSTWSQNELVTP